MAQIIGQDDLSDGDKKVLEFGTAFEKEFLSQKQDENRSIGETLDLGWKLLRILPREYLDRISPKYVEKYLGDENGN